MPAYPRTLCVPHSPPSHPSVKNTEHSKANMRALGHPNYPSPGSKEPGVLPPDMCEHSVAWILFSSWYKDPTIHPTYVLPSILYCSPKSESAAQPHCPLLGAEGQLGTKPFLPSPTCVAKPWMEAGPAPSVSTELKKILLKVWLLKDALTSHDLLCRDNLSSPTSLPPPGLTGSWDCWSRACWFVKGSLPFQTAFQEARNCNLQFVWFLFPKVVLCVPMYVPGSLGNTHAWGSPLPDPQGAALWGHAVLAVLWPWLLQSCVQHIPYFEDETCASGQASWRTGALGITDEKLWLAGRCHECYFHDQWL